MDKQRIGGRMEEGSNTSTVTLRVVGGDEKGSLKPERVKYDHESQGTWTRGRLRWRGPAACTKDRPVLSSERGPHKNKTVTIKESGARHQGILINWLSVAMWLWLWFERCGGGVEYYHRSSASRKRRRKGKSRIWDSKIWSRVPRDSDPRMTALVRTSSNCKREIRPLVSESAPYQQPATIWLINIWP
jgi:hypothetical protein